MDKRFRMEPRHRTSTLAVRRKTSWVPSHPDSCSRFIASSSAVGMPEDRSAACRYQPQLLRILTVVSAVNVDREANHTDVAAVMGSCCSELSTAEACSPASLWSALRSRLQSGGDPSSGQDISRPGDPGFPFAFGAMLCQLDEAKKQISNDHEHTRTGAYPSD